MSEEKINMSSYIDKRVSGIFLSGFIAGIIASMTGLIPFIVGMLSGILISNDNSVQWIKKILISSFCNIYKQIKLLKKDK